MMLERAARSTRRALVALEIACVRVIMAVPIVAVMEHVARKAKRVLVAQSNVMAVVKVLGLAMVRACVTFEVVAITLLQ